MAWCLKSVQCYVHIIQFFGVWLIIHEVDRIGSFYVCFANNNKVHSINNLFQILAVGSNDWMTLNVTNVGSTSGVIIYKDQNDGAIL